jgi:hypothetical protein
LLTLCTIGGIMKLTKQEARDVAAFRRSHVAATVRKVLVQSLEAHRLQNEAGVSTAITAARVQSDKALLEVLFDSELQGA